VFRYRPAAGAAPPRRSAFTLIELLAALGIIAVLIGLLLPALSGARRRSRQLACLANLRSVATVVEVYMQTSETYPDVDAFPIGPQAVEDITGHTNCLPVRLLHLMPDRPPNRVSETWYCPVKGAEPPPLGLRALGHGTYPYNSAALRSRPPWTIASPAATGLLREMIALDRVKPEDRQSQIRYGPAHAAGQNLLYLDGHAGFSTDQAWVVWGGAEFPAFPPGPVSQPAGL
jgi:prepilin-type N-terminal cleavage/methylation domain-containing protein